MGGASCISTYENEGMAAHGKRSHTTLYWRNLLVLFGSACRSRGGREVGGGGGGGDMHLAVQNFSQLGLGDVAEHQAEQLRDAPGLREDSPDLLAGFQPFAQPVVPAAEPLAEQGRFNCWSMALAGQRCNRPTISKPGLLIQKIKMLFPSGRCGVCLQVH